MKNGLVGSRIGKAGLGSFFALVALMLVLFAVPGQAQTNVNAKINFQPDNSPVPNGYTKDTGAAYDSGRGFGWVEQDSLGNATPTPLDISPNTRDRGTLSDQRLDTLTHMQFPPDSTNPAAVKTPAAWQYDLPDGNYDVTVAVGDPSVGNDPEEHTINFEGKNAISKFVPSGAKGADTRNKTATITVSVTDGKLTMDAIGGTNTKPDYVEITSATATNERPSVAGSNPADGATNVALSSGVATTSLNLVNSGVENSTITTNTVKLIKVSDNSVVPSDVNGTGGGDAITLTPVNNLQPNTQYRFEISDGVKDLDGLAFRPYSSTFTTGTTDIFNPPGVTTGDVGDAAFDRVAQSNVPSKTYTSVEMGPDDRLYAATVEGEIYRFPVNAQSGELGSPTLINTVRDNTNDCDTSTSGNNGCTDKRLIMGITFEPGSTASNPKLWVSHSTYGYRNMKDWGGKLSVLSGSNLGQYRDVLTNVPRSSKDHQINSIAFHNDKIYIPVGATTAMGAYDDAWKGTERLLSTSIIEVDYKNIGGTLDTRTVEAGGPYNPYAASAPVKIYATGVRNAVDLVWHSNGELYVPTNGSAGGSNAPATTEGFADSEACKTRRPDGPYTGPAIPNFDGDNTDPRNANGKEIDPNTGELQPRMRISKTQEDYLYRVKKGGYYGNPNPVRCEWVLNGGNPTAGSGNDPGENPAYPAGTKPDRNWRGWAYNFQNNQSPNGAIEYKSDNFGGKLKGKLLVVRYSNGDDVVVLHPNGGDGDINQQNIGVPGLAKNSNGQTMVDPLDLIEDTRSGNLYVTEGVKNPPDNTGKITLLRARDSGEPRPANISLDKSQLITNAVNGTTSAQQTVTVKNEGGSDLNISGISLSGANAGQFKISSGPTGSVTLAPGETQEIGVVFDPTSVGPKGASLDIASNDTDTSVAKVNLRGLGTKGTGGSNEPSLQWILDTYEIPVNAGDPDPTNNAMPTDPLLGDEVKAQRFEAASDSPVTVEPLAVFGPDANNPVVQFGHYTADNAASKQELFQVSNNPKSNAQTLNVPGGEKSFDAGTGTFGFYSTWPFFNNRDVYTQDSLNTFNNAIPHHVRAYPLPGEQNAYVVATEETTSGFDYQDVVVIVRNVKPLAAASDAEIETQNLDATRVAGEPAPGLYDDWMVFSRINAGVTNHKFHDTATLRIKNTNPDDTLEISDLKISDTTEFTLPNGEKTLSIAPGGSKDVQVKFIESAGGKGIREQTLTIFSNDADEPRTVVQLRGAFMTQPEGGNEVDLTQIARAFGYTTEIGQPLQEENDTPLAGDEVRSKLWKRVDSSQRVYVRQLAAYHGPGSAGFQITGTGGTSFGHDGDYFQSILPVKGNGDPAAEVLANPAGNFEIKAAGYSTNTDGNLGVRMWPVKDRDGKVVSNAYYIGQDYVQNGCGAGSANCDYNDNVYLVTNVQPVTLPAPIDLAAAGKDGQVELSWTSITNSGNVGYNVYRSTSEQVDTSGTPLNGSTPLTETSYTDSGVTNGTTYHYVVEAVEGSQKSRASKTASATPTEPSSNTNFKVNFQSETAPVPDGYFRDYGQPYGLRSEADQGNGMVYGWVEPGTSTPLDLTKNGRDRNSNSDQRLDTLMHMQAGSAVLANPFNGTAKDGSWEVSVPDGAYKVTVAAGDASVNSDPESHLINVEGKNAIDNFVPSGPAGSDTRHKTATLDSVTVSDGRMTIDANGGQNSKINYVEVQKAAADTTAPAAPANFTATAGNGQVELAWNANTENDLKGYNVYRDTSAQVDTSGAPLNDTPLTNASFTDDTAQNGTTYYYIVTAIDNAGNESEVSTTASATPKAGPAPDTDIKVNFQSETAPVPSGHLRDFGQPYGERTSADQGSGQSYGWVKPGTSTPLDLTKNGRDRNRAGIEQRLDTLIHMQYGDIQPQGSSGNLEPGAWEIAVPDGTYDVTVSVGDQPGGSSGYDSQHSINIEGKNAVDRFQATAQDEYEQATVTVDVTDGELTMDAIGGTNTKPNYVEIVGNTAAAENQAPTVTKPDNQTSVEGDDASLQVEAKDPDANDTLTYEASGLPAGLSIAPDTGLISGTIESGAAQQDPYTVEVTATDDGDPAKSGTATFNWTVTAPQASGCPPRSTLDCAEVPVELPYNVTFDGTEGGLKGTGFTMVDPPSAPLMAPSNPNVPGYEPGNLTVADGDLTIKSTQGIMYVNPAKSSKTNSQVNALGVGFDAAGKATRIETNATVPAFPSAANSEQGGLWFGLDEDNYAKLAVVNTGGGNAKIQLAREINAVSNGENAGDEVNTANVTKPGDAIKLTMVPDAAAGEVTAFYKIGDAEEVEVGTLPLPEKFFAGTKLNQSSTETASFAGIFDTNRRGATPINMSFKDFSVGPQSQPQPNEAPVANNDAYDVDEGATLDVNAAEGVLSNDTDADQGDTLNAALVEDVKNGTLTLNDNGSFSYEPNQDFSGEDTFTYKANDGTDDSQTATVTITVNAVNTAPVVDPIQDQSVQAGQTKTVQVTATDADEGDTIELSIEGPAFAILTDNGDGTGSIELAPGTNAIGEYDITVTASDGAESSSKSFKATVTEEPNQAPTIEQIGPQSATEGGNFSLQVEANDPDQGDTLTYEATGLPDGLEINQNTGEISGTVANGASTNSPYTVDITVSDGTDSAAGSFELTVDPKPVTEISADPSDINFGQVEVDQDKSQQVTLNNTGNQDVQVQSTDISGDNPGQFAAPLAEPVVVKAGESTDLTVKFAPTGTGSRSAVLSVTYDGPGSPLTIQLSGEGVDKADTDAPATPTGFKADGSAEGIALTWNANSEADLAGYNVYRRAAGETEFTKLNTDLLTDPKYNDTKAPEGTTSYYRVTAVDKAGNESNFALESAYRPVTDTTAPATPRNLTATPSQSGIALDWADNSEADLAGYNVSRRVDGEDKFTKLNTELLEVSEYNDTKAPGGKRSYYHVTAVDKAGNESNFAADGALRSEIDAPLASPKNANFGNVAVGGNATKNVTLKNPGSESDGAIVVNSGELNGDESFTTDFKGPITLAPGETKVVKVSFAPRSTGLKEADLVIKHDRSDKDLVVSLSGTGTAKPGACTIIGTQGNDTLRGTNGDDVICGLGGDDKIYGLDGNDNLKGGPGENRLVGGNGNDTLVGGNDVDEAYGQDGDDRVIGLGGNDILKGGSGTNRIVGGNGNDRLIGGNDLDTIYGQDGRDVLLGLSGNDRMIGGNDGDRVYGQNGNDTLVGQGGNDALVGGRGRDRMFGNTGRDILNGRDGVRGNDYLNGGSDRDRGVADPRDRIVGIP